MPFSVPNKNGKTSIPRNPHPLPSPISPIPEHPISASTKGTFSTRHIAEAQPVARQEALAGAWGAQEKVPFV